MSKSSDLDLVILCGGLGLRLRKAVNDRPKAMAEIKRRPFLDILLEYCRGFGLRRFILSAGYMSENIKEYYAKSQIPGIEIVDEKGPLGTGGAVKKLRNIIRSEPFLIMNGDSFCKADLNDFVAFHRDRKALLSLVLTKDGDRGSSGCVKLDRSLRVASFNEKKPLEGAAFINAGIYLFEKRIFSLMPRQDRFSLEYDFFPSLIGNDFYGYVTKAKLLDIGTPEGLKQARDYFTRG